MPLFIEKGNGAPKKVEPAAQSVDITIPVLHEILIYPVVFSFFVFDGAKGALIKWDWAISDFPPK